VVATAGEVSRYLSAVHTSCRAIVLTQRAALGVWAVKGTTRGVPLVPCCLLATRRLLLGIFAHLVVASTRCLDGVWLWYS
jgi:hypothetical protein